MLTLIAAVLMASFVGSTHCVGMCGPFALWATMQGRSSRSVAAYHLGRLTTFLSAGLAAGAIGSTLQIGGDLAGWQSLAAKLAGGSLVMIGLLRLWVSLGGKRIGNRSTTSVIAKGIARVKPFLATQGPSTRAYLTGLMTTWLPCGWLYMFVLLAAGTGGVVSALLVMAAFWLGTLPALTVVMFGANTLADRYRRAVPVIAALLLVAAGTYTATGRASADLSSLHVGSIDDLTNQTPPCCESPGDGAVVTEPSVESHGVHQHATGLDAADDVRGSDIDAEGPASREDSDQRQFEGAS